LELLQEAAPVVIPPEEPWSLVSEDKELAELGRLLEINVGEASGLGINKVQRRWFTSTNNVVTALESHEVIEQGGEESR
jgi:hypothetical protein